MIALRGWNALNHKSLSNFAPFIGFDIETYSPNGFPKNFEDPVVAATIALSINEDFRNGLIVLSSIFPPSSETLILKWILNTLASLPRGCILTYNGKRFDITYIMTRAERCGINYCEKALGKHNHIDLYEKVKQNGRLSSFKQKVVEQFLGIKRQIIGVEGANYYKYYERFLGYGDLAPLLYNIEDAAKCIELSFRLKNDKAFIRITKQ